MEVGGCMEHLKKKEVWIIVILLGILVTNRFMNSIDVKHLLMKQESNKVEIDEVQKLNENEHAVAEPVRIKVDISGAIKQSGVYTLNEGDRVEDVINRAGGLVGDVDRNTINQAEFLYDGQKIVILEAGDPLIENDYTGGKSVNINRATVEQLIEVNGIGEKTAEKIIDSRKKNGPFKSIEELTDVSGIGPNKLEGMIDEITIH